MTVTRRIGLAIPHRLARWILVAGLVAATACGGGGSPGPGVVGGGAPASTAAGPAFEERNIAVGVRCLRVEVADTADERAQGLKHRDDLGGVDGMLFLFEGRVNAAFTMSEVRIPLTIGFYDEAGVRVDAVDMEPCPDGSERDCPTYRSKHPFQKALEVEQGRLPDGPLVMRCAA